MSSEGNLIAAALDSREAWQRTQPHLTRAEFSPFGWQVWKGIEEWYSRDQKAKFVEDAALEERLLRNLENQKHREGLKDFIANLPEHISAENVVADALDIKRHTKGLELAALIAENAPYDKMMPLVQEFQQLLAATGLSKSEREVAPETAEDFAAYFSQGNRLGVLPKSINKLLRGGMLPGQVALIFGRPESGKTALTVNATAGFLMQGAGVLYVGNEDPIGTIKARILSRMSKLPPDSLEQNWAKAIHVANGLGFDKLHIEGLSPGSIPEVEELVNQYRPQVVVLDQIRNMHAGGDNLTKNMEQAAIAFRGLVKRKGLRGISVAQARAGSDDYPKVWFDVGDVDSSRTGLPGQLDLMIGIGYDDDMRERNQRAISIVKNKVGGQLARMVMEFDPLTNIFRGGAL